MCFHCNKLSKTHFKFTNENQVADFVLNLRKMCQKASLDYVTRVGAQKGSKQGLELLLH